MSSRKNPMGMLTFATILFVTGCGSNNSSDCKVVGLNVTPASSSVDHTATPPANSQQLASSFLFGGQAVCTANAAALVNSTWTASDPALHFSAPQGSQVNATCSASVANPVTITATSVADPTLKGQATLTCK